MATHVILSIQTQNPLATNDEATNQTKTSQRCLLHSADRYRDWLTITVPTSVKPAT
jgi:hypothetical protein